MLKDQLHKLKENWLLVALIIVVLIASSLLPGTTLSPTLYKSGAMVESAQSRYAIMPDIYPAQDGFAPEEQDRLITKTATLSTEVKRGDLFAADERVKAIVSSFDGYILHNDVSVREVGRKSYHNGNYNIKVNVKKYDALVQQLKDIGEVQSVNEQAEDVTGQHKDLSIELQAEKERLQRYKDMLKEAQTVSEKIELSDRIFNQERTVKYLEQALKNVGEQVSYATVNFYMKEKPSPYANVVFVALGELVQALVESVNMVLKIIFVILPFAVLGGIVWFIVRTVRKKK